MDTIDIPFFKEELTSLIPELESHTPESLAAKLKSLAVECEAQGRSDLIVSKSNYRLLTTYKTNNFNVGNTALDLGIVSQGVSTRLKKLASKLPDDFFVMMDVPYKSKFMSVVGFNPKYVLKYKIGDDKVEV